MLTASASITHAQVENTVVSVGPYMFIRGGADAPTWAAHHARTSCGSRGSPPRITYRNRAIASRDAYTSRKPLNTLGVWVSTVTPASQARRYIASGDRAMSRGAMTSRPPCRSAPQISSTEKSNVYEWNRHHTS